MENLINLEIVTPEERFLNKDCYMVLIPGSEGVLGVLANHVPLIVSLSTGILVIYSDNKTIESKIFVSGGFVEISAHGVIVLADQATFIQDLEISEIESIIQLNKTKLQENVTEEEKNKIMNENLAYEEVIKTKQAR